MVKIERTISKSTVINVLHPHPLPLAGLQNQKQHSNNYIHLTGKNSRIYEHLRSLVERAALQCLFWATLIQCRPNCPATRL